MALKRRLCGRPHDPQMTQIHADEKQGMDVRVRRFHTRIRMSVLSKRIVKKPQYRKESRFTSLSRSFFRDLRVSAEDHTIRR